jgi:hypothetical protein
MARQAGNDRGSPRQKLKSMPLQNGESQHSQRCARYGDRKPRKSPQGKANDQAQGK